MSLLHQDDDLEPETAERELTLSTGAIFGIFAGLVLLCALFFGFGYIVRGRQVPAPILATVAPESAPTASTNFNTFKPAAGSPQPTKPAAPAPAPSAESEPPAEDAKPVARPSAPPEAAPLVRPTPPPAQPRPLAVSAPPAIIPTGSFIVQVAAVSHEEDASLLVNALKAKGYPAAARNEPQDKLLHIQVGPYATRPAAEAIKQRLSADGYNNPIVK